MKNILQPDVLIFGGGIAGLWLLDRLRREGYAALLLERHALGRGQTMAMQGIIHGGLKYALSGILTGSAQAIRGMPKRWDAHFRGETLPDLRMVHLRATSCLLWSDGSVVGQLSLQAAKMGLQTPVMAVSASERPIPLRGCREVYAVAEPVVDPQSLLAAFIGLHHEAIIHVPSFDPLYLEHGFGVGCRNGVQIRPKYAIFTAGETNEALRSVARLSPGAMQRRPLHFPVLVGDLPDLNGHCIHGAKTRITVTTQRRGPRMAAWQIGGQVSEDGVGMGAQALKERVFAELAAALPGYTLPPVEFFSFPIDRAEGRHPSGARPEDPVILRDEGILTVWPTKFALVPLLADWVLAALPSPSGVDLPPMSGLGFQAPEIAPFPWPWPAE